MGNQPETDQWVGDVYAKPDLSLPSHNRHPLNHSGTLAAGSPHRAAGRICLQGRAHPLSAYLLALGRLQFLGQVGQGRNQSRRLSLCTPRSLLFIPRSLSTRVLSLFLSCTACCFPGSLLPPLSAKCQSSHRMSSSALTSSAPLPQDMSRGC